MTSAKNMAKKNISSLTKKINPVKTASMKKMNDKKDMLTCPTCKGSGWVSKY